MSTRQADPQPAPDGAPQEGTGGVLFARYAYPPNELGYCGPGDGSELLEVAAGVGGDDVATRAPLFDGAWPYLKLIASSTGIADPLDRRVVEAYWVGSDLLDGVDDGAFAEVAQRSFASQPGAEWECLRPAHPSPAPHHSFHVLAIYPWMSLLRQGRRAPALTVLNRCRIRWGQVVTARGDHVEVRGPRLVWDGRALGLGDDEVETVRWAQSGRSLSATVETGAWVSMHWDWVCDTLSRPQLDALRRFTARQIDVTNRVGAGQR